MVLNTDRTAEKPIKMILYREKMCSESFCCPACNERLVNTVSLSYSRVITVSFCFLLFFFPLSLFLSHTYSPFQGLKQQPPPDPRHQKDRWGWLHLWGPYHGPRRNRPQGHQGYCQRWGLNLRATCFVTSHGHRSREFIHIYFRVSLPNEIVRLTVEFKSI